MSGENKTCIVICGPTAVGKTDIAIKLAKHFTTEIISADSRQCYRELNIGVAKPSYEELATVPHFFINSHSIFDEVNVADFERYAESVIQEIFKAHPVAVIVGGTGLYIRAFVSGLDEIAAVDGGVRAEIRKSYELNGIEWLRNSLVAADPLFSASDDLYNPQRMMRALEVMLSTGRSIRSYQTRQVKTHDFEIIKIGLELPREELYQRINSRVDKMMEAGLLEEVKNLVNDKDLNALNTVGYEELFGFLSGDISLENAVDQIKQNTRHYAKRQMTWFKKDPEITWFSPAQTDNILDFLGQNSIH